MARAVLLIEPDVDMLGALASMLRSRGLEVWIADSVESAVARLRETLPDVVLVAVEIHGAFERAVEGVPGISQLPRFRLIGSGEEADPDALRRDHVDAIARRVHALPSRTPSIVPEASDFRGDLAQVPVVDLIQLLTANRRSGILTLQTPLGAGEIRFGEGDVIDALYRRLEGKKALFRLLGEREGSFSFVGAAAAGQMRRIDLPSHLLLMDGVREIDEARELRASLALGNDALIALSSQPEVEGEVDSMVLGMSAAPHTLSELLDEVSALDLEVLQAVSRLLVSGAIRRIAGGTRRVELADPERLGVLAALAKRVARAGFRDIGRVAIAASPSRLMSIMASLGRIAEAMMPSDAAPSAPIPHVLATLRLGDGVDLDIMGIPLVESFAPLWALVLPGCSALACLEATVGESLEGACQVAAVPLVDSFRSLGPEDCSDPEVVALMVQRLLENAAGA